MAPISETVVPKSQIVPPKSQERTDEETTILEELAKNPKATQRELAIKIGKSTRTVKRRTVEMQEKGLIRRENGKRNGFWRIL